MGEEQIFCKAKVLKTRIKTFAKSITSEVVVVKSNYLPYNIYTTFVAKSGLLI